MLFAWNAMKFALAAVYVAVRCSVWICWHPAAVEAPNWDT